MAGGDDDPVADQQVDTSTITTFGREGHHAENVFPLLKKKADLFQGWGFDEFLEVGAVFGRVDIGSFEVHAQ